MKIDVTTLRGRTARARWNRACIGDIFERIATNDPDRILLNACPGAYESEQNAQLSARRADDLANQYANAMIAKGLAPGSIVMLFCDNSVEAIIAKFGLAKAGIIVAPINPNLSADIVEELVELCEPSAIVVDLEFEARIAPIVEKSGRPIMHCIAVGETNGCHVPTFREFISNAPTTEPDVEVGGDDIWQLLFTSGSTSAPKGAMVSHHNTLYYAMSYIGAITLGLDYESDATICSFLPIVYHVGDGLIYSAILAGGTLVLGRRFDPAQIAKAIDQFGVTCLWGGAPHAINAVVAEFTKNPLLRSERLRSIIFGWAPLDPGDFDRIKSVLGAKVKPFEIIGQTEVCCGHRFWIDKHIDLFRSTAPLDNYVGEPHPLLGAAILTKDGAVVEAADQSTLGEAVYRSPALMAGYYKREAETIEAFSGGWFHGGDAFKWGKNGQRILADRFKDIVKSGGENVACIRVEAIINQHPGVFRSAVVGIPHPRWGEAVTAFVIEKPGEPIDTGQLNLYLKSKLANFECPKRIVVVNDFPESVGGKIKKHILRSIYNDLYKEDTNV